MTATGQSSLPMQTAPPNVLEKPVRPNTCRGLPLGMPDFIPLSRASLVPFCTPIWAKMMSKAEIVVLFVQLTVIVMNLHLRGRIEKLGTR